MCDNLGCGTIKYAKYAVVGNNVNVGVSNITEPVHISIESEGNSERSVLVSAAANNPVSVSELENDIYNFDPNSSYFIVRWFADNAGDIDYSTQLQFKDSDNNLTDCLVFARNRKFIDCFGAGSEFILEPIEDGKKFSDNTLARYSDDSVINYSA